jgi:hypothetical protein
MRPAVELIATPEASVKPSLALGTDAHPLHTSKKARASVGNSNSQKCRHSSLLRYQDARKRQQTRKTNEPALLRTTRAMAGNSNSSVPAATSIMGTTLCSAK